MNRLILSFILLVSTVIQAFSQENDIIWQNNIKQEYQEQAHSACVTPDEQFVVLGCESKIIVLDLMSGGFIKEISEGVTGIIYSIEVLNDNNTIIAGGIDFLKLFNLETTELIKEVSNIHDFLESDYYNIYFIEKSPNENEIVVVALIHYMSTTRDYLFKYNIDDESFKKMFDNSDIKSPTFSPNGNYFAAAYNTGDRDEPGNIKLWKTDTWESIRLYGEHHFKLVWSIAFSPDNAYLASCGSDGKIKIWDLNTAALKSDFYYDPDRKYLELLKGITFSPNSKFLISGYVSEFNPTFTIFNVPNGDLVFNYPFVGTKLLYSTLNSENILGFGGDQIGLYYAHWEPNTIIEDLVGGDYSILYPNPSDGDVNIVFNLLFPSTITISIYDNLSNELEIVFNGFVDSGMNRIIWNSSKFPSGIYWCRIKGDGVNETYKIIINK